MTESPSPPPPPPAANPPEPPFDRSSMHIAGAGTLGMYIFIGSLSMLFASSLILFTILRVTTKIWSPADTHGIPGTLWLSTIVLLSCSGTIHLASSAIKRDDEKKLVLGLLLTLGLGLVFLGLQLYNWIEFYHSIPPEFHSQNLYMVTFFLLTGLHAAHVIGGLIPLAIVAGFAAAGRYSRNFYPGVRYCTIYWHFLDITWVVVFIALFIGER